MGAEPMDSYEPESDGSVAKEVSGKTGAGVGRSDHSQEASQAMAARRPTSRTGTPTLILRGKRAIVNLRVASAAADGAPEVLRRAV